MAHVMLSLLTSSWLLHVTHTHVSEKKRVHVILSYGASRLNSVQRAWNLLGNSLARYQRDVGPRSSRKGAYAAPCAWTQSAGKLAPNMLNSESQTAECSSLSIP